uniref:Uncharacterized protein n=1 Tax=Ananas comosus var. bracteatus TaxID=296719 RepID=A0A6V7NGQ6_ANACO|nr:unnamed protein product [Ananas comosus var. bracteatus]
MATTRVTREKASQIHTKWIPEEKLPSPTPLENTYSPMIGNEVEPPLVLASFEEGGRDHNPLIDEKAIVADPQDIASPRVSLLDITLKSTTKPTLSVSKDNSDSPQDTWVVDEDVSDTNMAVSAHTLIGDKSKDNNMLLKEGGGAGHPISSDHGVGQESRPTLIDHLIEIVRTSSYHTYPVIQVKITEYCEILSRIGVDTSSLNTRLQKLFKEAEAIREVAAHPSYSSSARILKAKEHMSRITKELKDYDSKRSSLTRTKEKALTLLDQQRQKVEDLERTLATVQAKEAKLNDEVNTIKECIFRLDSGKDKAVTIMEGAIEEFGATEGSHSTTVEFNHLSGLIKDFEHHCKEFDL